jgi:hypothetical protein
MEKQAKSSNHRHRRRSHKQHNQRRHEFFRRVFLCATIFRPHVVNRILGVQPPTALLRTRIVNALCLLPHSERKYLASRPWFVFHQLAETNFGDYNFLKHFYRQLKRFLNAK